MRAKWILALAAGAAIGAAPIELAAQQGRSGMTRQEQLREQQQRAAERERLRVERDRERQRQVTYGTVRRDDVFADPRRRNDERDRRSDERDRRRDERDRYDPRDIFGSDSRGKNGNGPAFCRSGAGHPVHGRQWCLDKGFGLGTNNRSVWGDIILRQPRDRRYNESLGRGVLGDILGSVILGRFESFGRQYASGPITGRFVPDGGATVLQLNMGSTPIARLVDTNRDGRVDTVITRR